MKLYTIVNEQDIVQTYKTRPETLPQDIFRTSALLIFNSKHEILLTQRALTKKFDPGVWGSTASGTLEKDHTYLQNIIQETAEETGLTLDEKELIVGSKQLYQMVHKVFCQFYFYKQDLNLSSLKLEPMEVAKAKWWTIEDFYKAFHEDPKQFQGRLFTMVEELEDYIKRN